MSGFKITMEEEAHAIMGAIPEIAKTYDDAIPHLVCRNPIILSGMGKSGLVAQKTAATFRSLGVPALYVHPGDASHGDLGAYTGDAVAVLLSNSGSTPELADTILFCQSEKIPIIAVTSRPKSALADYATVTVCYGEVSEACPAGLAPTTSTTVQMAVCDALALDVAQARGFDADVFAKYHPGGKLGARLSKVKDVMLSPVPVVRQSDTVAHAAIQMTGRVAGIVLVKGLTGIVGVLTDGDLRRAGAGVFKSRVGDVMSRHPIKVPDTMTCDDAAIRMDELRVTKLLVEDALGAIVGVVNRHDC